MYIKKKIRNIDNTCRTQRKYAYLDSRSNHWTSDFLTLNTLSLFFVDCMRCFENHKLYFNSLQINLCTGLQGDLTERPLYQTTVYYRHAYLYERQAQHEHNDLTCINVNGTFYYACVRLFYRHFLL